MTGEILITGANGFVGRTLCGALARSRQIRGACRSPADCCFLEQTQLVYATLSPDFDWSEALVGIESGVHCAARVHVMREAASDPLEEFRAVNVSGTLNLARQAAKKRVRRFIFLSSIGVNGAETFGRPFTACDAAAPHSFYAMSKHEAELELLALAKNSGMEVVILRPPLIYGPAAPGNFAILLKWLNSGIPLPLGGVSQNQRSLVGLDNLVDLIVKCIDHPAAANQTFLVSDGEDLSTAELLQRMGVALGRPARLVPVPVALLKAGAAMLGRSDVARRLCGSLQVDISKTRELLDWVPPVSVDEGLLRTTQHWLQSRGLHATGHTIF